MKLIIGLGNPEQRYDGTRHNTGFFVLDAYAQQHGLTFQPKSAFKASVAEHRNSSEKVLLAKPSTYYNLSGQAVQALLHFYKLTPEDILVIHDELALPFGTIRTRQGGSDAGNNGIKSINEHIGTTTARLRIGIANSQREQIEDADFVLARFSPTEQSSLRDHLPAVLRLIDAFIADTFEPTTHTP